MSTHSMLAPFQDKENKPTAWIFSVCMLAAMYSLLLLTRSQHYSHSDLMQRCVLMNPRLSRLWSVANVEIGVGYFGVFAAMTYYVITIRRQSRQHLSDLGLAFAYLVCSFSLDFICVQFLSPWIALLIGDLVVMTFTLLVSRQLWFQRLLGVFVPMIFLTCGMGHLLEGMSYWRLTYTFNVPWAMVTADVGFAVLVNSARFPAFIKGSDIQDELDIARSEAEKQRRLFRDVLFSVTEGKLRFHSTADELPAELPLHNTIDNLTIENLSDARAEVKKLAAQLGFNDDQEYAVIAATGEALMNAIVHAKQGVMTLRADGETIQIWITDSGTGIRLEDLPNATLQKGWSSKGTMGMGFPLMLSLSDSVDMLTTDKGTTIVVTVNKHSVQGITPRSSEAINSFSFESNT